MIPTRCLIATCCFCLTPFANAVPGLQQTPQEVELTIGSSTHLLPEGVTTMLRVNGRAMPVKVVRRAAQVVQIDDFSFHYPDGFSLLSSSHSESPSSASWMLKGKSCQLTVHRKEKGATFDFLVDHMAKFYAGLANVSGLREQQVDVYFGGKSVRGVRFLMKSKGEGLNYQEYFQLPVRSSQSNYFLIIHAKPGNQEAERAKSLIGATLKE